MKKYNDVIYNTSDGAREPLSFFKRPKSKVRNSIYLAGGFAAAAVGISTVIAPAAALLHKIENTNPGAQIFGGGQVADSAQQDQALDPNATGQVGAPGQPPVLPQSFNRGGSVSAPGSIAGSPTLPGTTSQQSATQGSSQAAQQFAVPNQNLSSGTGSLPSFTNLTSATPTAGGSSGTGSSKGSKGSASSGQTYGGGERDHEGGDDHEHGGDH